VLVLFLTDFYGDKDPLETFDSWADGISEQRHQKQQQQYWKSRKRTKKSVSDEKEKKSIDDEEKRKFQEKLEKEHEEYQNRAKRKRFETLVSAKKDYEINCSRFFKGKETKVISYKDIPWPQGIKKPVASTSTSGEPELSVNQNKLKEFLLCDFEIGDTDTKKKYLREQQVRWHPDRFLQKCGERLKPEDRDFILDHVNAISQLVNKFSEDIT